MTTCPYCGTDRIWLVWAAIAPWDTDGWSCVYGHKWAEGAP